jgi:hypothetical protein
MPQITIYVSEEDKPVVDMASRIAGARGSSFSKLITDLSRQYIQLHENRGLRKALEDAKGSK